MRARRTILCRLEGGSATVEVELSQHAISRFIERVRPTCEPRAAAREIERLAGIGRVSAHRPCWERAGRLALMYLTCGDVSFVVDCDRADPERLVATTCLVRGMRTRRDPAGPVIAGVARSGRRTRPYRRPSPGSLIPDTLLSQGVLS